MNEQAQVNLGVKVSSAATHWLPTVQGTGDRSLFSLPGNDACLLAPRTQSLPEKGTVCFYLIFPLLGP